MDELLDMITKDESPSGISDAIKDALYAKSAEKIGAHKDSVAASLFGLPPNVLPRATDPAASAGFAGAAGHSDGVAAYRYGDKFSAVFP